MENQKNNSAKFAFLYLLSLVALGFVAVNTGQIIFQLINKYISDLASEGDYGCSSSLLKFSIAALVIATPIYYLTNRFIYKSLFKGELDKESGVRKWLTYLIIFIAFLVMIGSLIGILVSFLNGELSNRFVLKALTIFVIAGIIFAWYFYDIRREKVIDYKDKLLKLFFYGSLLLVIAVFVNSLFIVESPKLARERKLDQIIINNFSQIDSNLTAYYQTYEKLPASLEILQAEYKSLTTENFKNHVSKEVFKYKVIGDREYELCTSFLTDNTTSIDNKDNCYYEDPRWAHASGEQCISQKVQVFNKEGMPVEVLPIR